MGGGDYWKKCFIFISLVCIVIFGIIYIETPVNPFHGVKATCKAENNSLAGYIRFLSGTSIINSSKNKNVIIVVILVLFYLNCIKKDPFDTEISSKIIIINWILIFFSRFAL